MFAIIFITLFCSVCTAISLCCFLKIKNVIEELQARERKEIEIVERFMKTLVTEKQMLNYLEKMEKEFEKIVVYKDKFSKEKWKNLRSAFGGNIEDIER